MSNSEGGRRRQVMGGTALPITPQPASPEPVAVAGTCTLLALKTVKSVTTLSEMSIRRMVERNQFPKPIKLAPNRIAWREPDVSAWIHSRVEAA